MADVAALIRKFVLNHVKTLCLSRCRYFSVFKYVSEVITDNLLVL